jgi:hypothetical protein
MRKSAYPAVRRAHALLNAAVQMATARAAPPPDPNEVRRLLDACSALIPEVLKDPSPPARKEAFDLFRHALEGYRALDRDRQVSYRTVAAALDRAGAPESFRLLARGEFYIHYAWDARGNGLAATVTREGWRLFGERLREAEAALTRSWELDRSDPLAASRMITVAMGLGHERADMEVWFRRAMAADPDCREACTAKFTYLEPKWHGSQEELLAFARECARTKNWEAALPFILAGTHRALAGYQPNPAAYYRGDPSVWQDFQAVYEGYLEKYPDSRYDRTWYARYAYTCGRYREAHRQFEQLGDRYWPRAFGSDQEYRQVRDICARAAGADPAAGAKGRPALEPGPDGLTLERVDQNPGAYVGRTLALKALLSGPPILRGNVGELQVATGKLPRPINLRFVTTKDLVLRMAEAGAKGGDAPVRLTCTITEEKRGPETVARVTQVEVLDGQGRVVKTIK